jgi:hypothetical protein
VIARYGQAIERDLLHRYHLDLATEWRSRRWRRLLNLIDHLPRNSAYFQALSNDDLFAAQMLDQEDTAKAGAKRAMSEWSVEVELLSSLLDRVGELISVTLAAAGAKKPPKVTPAPRPATAVERVRNRRRWEKHQWLTARMLPHKREGETDHE